MASKKKQKDLFCYVTVKDTKGMKPKYKKMYLEITEINKEIIKRKNKKR